MTASGRYPRPLQILHWSIALLVGAQIALILVLLYMHHRTGFRGRHAARWLLVGYLLLLLAYPGVKFVRDVLIG